MLIPIKTLDDLGRVLRATRKAQNIRQEDLAGVAGVGHVFVREAEHGVETVSVGRLMKLFAELGLELQVDVPDEIRNEIAHSCSVALRPIKRRGQAPQSLKHSASADANDLSTLSSK
jgi:transcriptional regulator with XRE-family HTH domain